MKEDVKLWFAKAIEDQKSAMVLFDNKRHDDAAVYCHQVIEKALKALILQLENEVPKTHDLSHLAKRSRLQPHFGRILHPINSSLLFSKVS